MNDPQANPPDNPPEKDKQVVAVVASVTIMMGFVVYWIVQIQSVREMLELAYGS